MEKPFKNFSKKTSRIFIFAGVLILFIVALGIGIRLYQYMVLRRETEQQAVTTVEILEAKYETPSEKIVLPANIVAWHDATIYARTNGYVINWLVDIGSRVKTGDLLATISAPEVDAQLRQTEADLKTADANNVLAQITARRWKNLLRTDSVSKQETDEKVSDAQAKAAIVNATRATRDRLRDLVTFQRVVAPFDGIITSRMTDIGKLINAGSSNGTIPLFQIEQSDHLRLYVRIPQYYSVFIGQGLTAQLHFREYPGKIFVAHLLDSARAIDPGTRTLLTQFVVDNRNYTLMPGSYTEVELIVPANAMKIRLPVNTLIFRSKGLQVAVLDIENKAALKSITLSRDFGDYVEVSSGIKPGDRVIINPPDSLFEGEKVRIVTPPSGQASEQGQPKNSPGLGKSQ